MLSLFLAALMVTAQSTTMLDFRCSNGDTCTEVITFLSEENAKSENPVPDVVIAMLTTTCNTDDGYCSIDCSGSFSFVCASVPEGQIVVDASVVYCDPVNAWCAVDLRCTSDLDCTSKLPGYKCSSTGACMPDSATECTDNSDCSTAGFGYCDTRTYSGVTVSFCEPEPCANTDDCITSGYVCGESAVCVPPPPTTAPTPPTMAPSVSPTQYQAPCGFIVLETEDEFEPFARPLDVCSASFDNNGSSIESMMVTCNDDVYTRTVYDDDRCNGTVTSIETVGENCTESVDCVCGVGSQCEYATWTRYVDAAVNETCDGSDSIEMAVVLNECANGVMYECDGETDAYLLYETCDEGALNRTAGETAVCDLECHEDEVRITTTEMAPEIETTEEVEATEEGKDEGTPEPTVSKAKDDTTLIIIGCVIGGVILVLIVIGICLYCANSKDKPVRDTSGYGVVGGNDTENEDVEITGVETR